MSSCSCNLIKVFFVTGQPSRAKHVLPSKLHRSVHIHLSLALGRTPLYIAIWDSVWVFLSFLLSLVVFSNRRYWPVLPVRDMYCHGPAPSEPGPNHCAADGQQIEETKTDNINYLVLRGIAFDKIVRCTETITQRSFKAYEGNSLEVFAFTEMIEEF